jgi:hypothetical protein
MKIMSKRYTEGKCGDGAAILDNGVQITITEILNRLNLLDSIESKAENVPILGVRVSLPDYDDAESFLQE